MAVLCRFDELRVKTNKQLLQVIGNVLDRGIREAYRALGSYDDPAIAKAHFLKAKTACDESVRLASLVTEAGHDQRSEVEAKLQHLRELLEALSVIGTTPPPTEDQIAALALALRKAGPEGLLGENRLEAEQELQVRGECHVACVGL